MTVKSLLFITLLIIAATLADAQTASGPSFEVASVRLDRTVYSGDVNPIRGGPGTSDPGRIIFTKLALRFLISQAYDIEADRIEGPDWLKDLYGHSYTITATMPPDTTKEQFRLMLQNLLAERFGLKMHREVRSLPGFVLTAAPGGPKLSEWTPEPISDGPIPHWSEDAQGYPVLSPGRTACTYGGFMGGAIALKVTCRRSMADFAQDLGRFIK